jgi:hypothetical protein
LSLVSFFGGKLAAAPFGTFATISAHFGHRGDIRRCPFFGGRADIEPMAGHFRFLRGMDITDLFRYR